MQDPARKFAEESGAFTPEERDIIASCPTPEATQSFLCSLRYNFESDGVKTLRTFRRVVRDRIAHCIEGALAAATILSQYGYEAQLLCMEARDIDHIVFPYLRNGRWGCVAHSRDENLKGRGPQYDTIRDLVLSYHPYYYNYFTNAREDLTLRGYTLLPLTSVPCDWRTAESDAWPVERALIEAKYTALFPAPGNRFFFSDADGHLTWVDEGLAEAP